MQTETIAQEHSDTIVKNLIECGCKIYKILVDEDPMFLTITYAAPAV